MVARVQDLLADARGRADGADPGAAFFGLLARISDEVAAKRDISDALGDAALGAHGQLAAVRDDLHAAFGALLQRAQRAGAVRTDIGVSDLIALLKGLRATLQAGDDPGLRGRVLAVLCDGLRPPPDPSTALLSPTSTPRSSISG